MQNVAEVAEARERAPRALGASGGRGAELAEALTQTPIRVVERLIERARERFGEKGLIELTATIALENQRSRFNAAMGVLPQGWSRVCAVPAHQQDESAA